MLFFHHIPGQGYFQNSFCNFLPSGSSDRTLMVWAKVGASNIYIKHAFHYGSTAPSECAPAVFTAYPTTSSQRI